METVKFDNVQDLPERYQSHANEDPAMVEIIEDYIEEA